MIGTGLLTLDAADTTLQKVVDISGITSTIPLIKPDSISSLAALLGEQGIRVCLETVSHGPEGSDFKIKVSTTKARAKDILDVVCRNHAYKYDEHEGFVNLFPAHVRLLGDKYPLNRRVAHLKLENTKIHEAVKSIGRHFLNPLTFINGSPIHTSDKAQVSFIDVNNLTVREILNRLVKSAGLTRWNCAFDARHPDFVEYIID
jgi:hypothetical protein